MGKTRWKEEIEDLHDFFEAYFRGRETSLVRAEAALAPGFTIVGPNGVESNRGETLAALTAAHGGATDQKIITSDHQLLGQHGATIVASYIEEHEWSDRRTKRRSTVVFVVDPEGPNGLRWLRVHETWLDGVPTSRS